MENLIGNTPMIKINYEYLNKKRSIYVKVESYNLTGSIKDRMAYFIIQRAKEKKLLKEGMPIVEATSGNTGISLSAIGAYYKHPVYIFMPDWVSSERKKLMELFGAKVFLVSKEEGGFKEAIKRSCDYADKINGYRPDQFNNPDNVLAHYKTTAEEIIKKEIPLDTFTSGIGTGGTLMGISKRLKEVYKDIKIIALEPDTIPVLSQNVKNGSHKIEGIGDDFVPSIVSRDIIDDIVLINDEDAINMSKLLSRELGLGVGISSGANFLSAVLNNRNNKTLTIFVDDNKKYLTTDLSKPIDTNPSFVSNKIKLLDYEYI